MSAKIIIDKEVFLKYPAVFLEVEAMCSSTEVESSKVLLTPKSGSLVNVLVTLSKSDIEYTLRYDRRITATPTITKTKDSK
jgi:hypothetical protein